MTMKYKLVKLMCLSVLGPMIFVSQQASAQDTLARISETGKVRISIANQYPFAFKKPDGTLSGIDYEIAKRIMTVLGGKAMEGVVTDFGSMIPGLQADRVDLIAAGMFIRPDRCKQVAFSNPHYASRMGLLVAKGNPKKLNSIGDIKNGAGVTVATVQGGASDRIASEGGLTANSVRRFPDVTATVAALRSGRVDGVILDRVSLNGIVQENPDAKLEIAEPFADVIVNGKPSIQYAGFVFRQADIALVNKFNEALSAFVGSPEHLVLLAKYNMNKQDLPPKGITATEVCNP